MIRERMSGEWITINGEECKSERVPIVLLNASDWYLSNCDHHRFVKNEESK